MGIVKDDGAGHITITYGGMDAPFGGLDASAPDAYIAPNRLIDVANFALVNKSYVSCNWVPIPNRFASAGWHAATETLIGFGETSDILFAVSYESTTNDYYFTYLDDSNMRYAFPAPPNVGFGNGWSKLSFYTINGVLYMTGPGLGCIYQIVLPLYGAGYTAPTVLTTQLGASYLGELNGRLLGFSTIYQQPDGVTYKYQPYQVAWSAAQEQYGIWNVLTTNTSGVEIATGAGYNNIPDVEDTIQGFFSQGTNIYVIRTEGVSEITPLANGIEPFDFNHLWASPKGMGTRYPGTVTQYGSVGAFLSSIDIISMGYSGINVISGAAKSSVYGDISGVTNTFGTLSPFSINQQSDLYYVLTTRLGSVPSQFVSYFINVQTQETMYMQLTSPYTLNQTALVDQRVVSSGSISAGGDGTDDVTDYVVMATQAPASYPVLYYIEQAKAAAAADDNTLLFPPEEVAFLQDYTIDGIGIYLNGTVGESVSLSVSGVQFEDVTIDTDGWKAYRSMPNPTTTGVMTLTDLFLQLSLSCSSTHQMQVGKIVLYGSYTPARPF